MKMGLKKLALDCPENFNVKGNFEKRFGIKKEFYNFMKKHDISYKELKVLQSTKRANMDKIQRLLKISYSDIEDLKKTNRRIFKNTG